jgi:hypothetical protein
LVGGIHVVSAKEADDRVFSLNQLAMPLIGDRGLLPSLAVKYNTEMMREYKVGLVLRPLRAAGLQAKP